MIRSEKSALFAIMRLSVVIWGLRRLRLSGDRGAGRIGQSGRFIGAGDGNAPMLRCKKLTPAMFIPYLLQASPQFCHASCGSRNHRLCGLP
jgi:hypothetical protein